ncbi:tryptophan transporter [Virgibacillus sp. W0181]|uniref:tryptophan transporter n=1 Tax=Virgibacillus sp. W0181 TaxID=3391581 RepID=UPI003F44B01E
MNIRVLIILSLLVGMGAILHIITPPLLFGMKPDMVLCMMFLGIILFPKFQYVILVSIASGIVAALTTGVPGGQISNIIDKPITGLIFFALVLLVGNKMNKNISSPILAAIGTLISGAIFLSVALFIVGLLDGAFASMFVVVVLPAAVANIILMAIIYPIAQGVMKRSQSFSIS